MTGDARQPLTLRQHGLRNGRPVIALHGGPGARGSAGELARALADPLHVLEPWQRESSDVPLTVDRHIEDLAEIVATHTPDEAPALVGESWGAMLALAFAARLPERVCALLLVGCGTFDTRAREELARTLERRTPPELKRRLAGLEVELPDEAERLAEIHRSSDALYTFSRATDAPIPDAALDAKGHRESWADMLRLQAAGVYPAAFASIHCPVLMLHGAYDPHPGAMVRDGLRACIPHLEYQEFERCGHSPWVEEHARGAFLSRARGWLEDRWR